jgi:hypothetical protein
MRVMERTPRAQRTFFWAEHFDFRTAGRYPTVWLKEATSQVTEASYHREDSPEPQHSAADMSARPLGTGTAAGRLRGTLGELLPVEGPCRVAASLEGAAEAERWWQETAVVVFEAQERRRYCGRLATVWAFVRGCSVSVTTVGGNWGFPSTSLQLERRKDKI